MEQLYIREADQCDQEAIRQVTLAAYEEYSTKMSPRAWEEYRENILTTLADVRPAEQIVAEMDGEVVGTVLLYPGGTFVHRPSNSPIVLEYPEVRLLAVEPAARRQGVGTALMQECIRRASLSGVSKLTLHTTDMMEVGMRMYERLGFVRAPELDLHPGENIVVKGYQINLTQLQPR